MSFTLTGILNAPIEYLLIPTMTGLRLNPRGVSPRSSVIIKLDLHMITSPMGTTKPYYRSLFIKLHRVGNGCDDCNSCTCIIVILLVHVAMCMHNILEK